MSTTLDALVSKSGRALFLPIGFRFLLKLEQVQWDELCSDAALATFTLRAGQRLFKADGVINWFDDWLEAEGAGARVERGPLGVALGKPAPVTDLPDSHTFIASAAVARAVEIAGRLCRETGNEVTALAYLTGPRTLLERLFGAAAARRMAKALNGGKLRGADREAVEAAAELSLALAKAYCEAGCGALVLAEAENAGDLECLSALGALLNLAEYYSVPVLLLCRHALSAPGREAADRLQFVASPAGGKDVQTVPLEMLMNTDHASLIAWAKTIPAGDRSQVFMTEWEIPPGANPEAVIALRNEIVSRGK